MSLFIHSDSGIVWGFPVSAGRLFDYVALLKPRVMSLVVFTAFTGMVIVPSHVDPLIGFASLFAIAAGAGASGALNMWYDADIDALMRRTRNRPIPASRMSKGDALCFGLVLAVLSVLTLGLIANWLAAALLGFTIFFYVAIYDISLASLALFAIIFVWTPPHFWALALVKAEDYGRAGVPMLPNVKGPDHTRRAIFGYALVLAPLGLMPWIMGFASLAYGVIAIGLGALMVFSAKVYHFRTAPKADRCARQLFGFSILYSSCFSPPSQATGFCHSRPFDPWERVSVWTARVKRGGLLQKARRLRNVAISIALGCLAIASYAMTLAKFGTVVPHRPL